MEEGEMGEKKTKAQGHIPAPLYGLYTAPTWPEGFTGRIQLVNPSHKALQAVYGLETSLTRHTGSLTGSMRAIKPPSLLSRPPYGHKGACKAWK